MKESWNLIFKFVFGIRDWMTNIDNLIYCMGEKLIKKKKKKNWNLKLLWETDN